MLVSIITVCYNSETTIARTIESVLHQSHKEIEYIVIDGNSNDNTLSIIKQYEEEFMGRMKIVSEPDEGIYDAMNKGIKFAKGQLIGIINSDDFYETDAVELAVQAMRASKMQIIYGALKEWKEGKVNDIVWLSHEFLQERMICHPSCFITREVYEKYGTYDKIYTSAADYEFMLRVFEKSDVEFVPVYKVLANYTDGGISTTSAGYLDKLKMLYDKEIISKRRYRVLRIIEKLRRTIHLGY